MFGWGASKEGKEVVFPELGPNFDPANTAAIKDLVVKKVAEFEELASSNEGYNQLESGEPEVSLYDKPSVGSSFDTIKVIATLPISAQEAFDFFRDESKAKSWDADLLESVPHEKIDEDTTIYYLLYNTPFPITKREFVVVRHHKKYSDGSFLIANFSINHPSFKENSNAVRGATIISGWSLKPDNGQTRVTRITRLDPKGSIPAWVVNSFKGKAAKQIGVIKGLIKK